MDPALSPDRTCKACDKPLVRREGEHTRDFTKRRFCSRSCARRRLNTELTPLRKIPGFPGADVVEYTDAPEKCVCGGFWVPEDAALACRLCGRRVYVLSWMEELAPHLRVVSRDFPTLFLLARRAPVP